MRDYTSCLYDYSVSICMGAWISSHSLKRNSLEASFYIQVIIYAYEELYNPLYALK